MVAVRVGITRTCVCDGGADYVGFIKKVMKQMQQPQYTPMKKMEVDLRPLDAEQEKVQEGRDWLSILDLHSVVVCCLCGRNGIKSNLKHIFNKAICCK